MKRLPLNRLHACLAGVALVCTAGAAGAQPRETPAARADQLFQEGKAALAAGHYQEACPRLAESQRLDPATGTLLALALCHESEGKSGSAWYELTAVLEASIAAHRDDRVALVREHLAALQPRLSKLTVIVPPGHTSGGGPTRAKATVLRDDDEVPEPEWGQAVTVDPGSHRIEVRIEGQRPWKTVVRVGPDGDAQIVSMPEAPEVPAPADAAPVPGPVAAVAPPAPRPASAAPEVERRSGGRRLAGLMAGGTGVVALGLGSTFGALAISDRSNATKLCPTPMCSNAQGVSTNDRAKTEAWASDVGLGLGVLGVAAGAWLLLTDHGARVPGTALTVVPVVGPGMAGIAGRL